MSEHILNFGPNQESSLDEVAGGSPVAHNVVIDRLGSVSRRPGVTLDSSVTVPFVIGGVNDRPLIGLYATQEGALYAVQSTAPRTTYRVDAGNYSVLTAVPGTERPVFAETEALIVVAGGGRLQKIVKADGSMSELFASEATAPPAGVTHVVANNVRLLANGRDVNKTRVFYSSTQSGSASYAGHEDWVTGTSGSFQAESRPDPIIALGENSNEVWVWGSTTLQIYQPDPTVDYAPLPTQEIGLSAPASVVKVDRSFAWLDEHRRFVISDGRAVDIISGPIQKTLHGIADPSDCFGYRVVMGNVDALVWTFPADGRTFAYQVDGGWSQWSGWSESYQRFERFQVSAHAYDHVRGLNMVGLRNGFVAKLLDGHPVDFQNRIRAFTRTGFMAFGTNRRKLCTGVYLMLKRGKSTLNYEETAGTFSWRDELGPWERRPFELGSLGDDSFVVKFRSCGVFRRRQFELEFSGKTDFVLSSATVEVQELSI
jgi:hypothetical protein